jgi:hypothetical protein
MTPTELETVAARLEETAAELRSLALSMAKPETTRPFALVPSEPDQHLPKPRPTKPPTTLFQDCLRAFGEAWKTRYKRDYIFSPADRAQLGRLLGKLGDGVAELPALYAAYLSDPDPFVAQQGHSLRFFCSQINRYRAKRATDQRRLL